jgi:hypothetical protein
MKRGHCTTDAITASSVAEALLEAFEQCSSSSSRNILGLAPTALSNVTRQTCEKMCVTLPVMPMPWHLMRPQFGLTNALSGSRAWSHDFGVAHCSCMIRQHRVLPSTVAHQHCLGYALPLCSPTRKHARQAQAVSPSMAANNGTNSPARLADIKDLAAQEVAQANAATGSVRRFVLSLRLGLGSEDPDWFGVLAEAGVVDALASEGEAVGAQVNVLPEEFPEWAEQRALELDQLLTAVSQGAAQTSGDGGARG